LKNLATIVKSLEDETRLRIMALLPDADAICVCDFMVVLQLPQSTISRHLSHLKNAGWLSDRRAGVWIKYSLASDLGPLHRTLAATLRNILAINETAKQDRERLKKLSREQQCCTGILNSKFTHNPV
jgi:ArsR family transcriptional regulator